MTSVSSAEPFFRADELLPVLSHSTLPPPQLLAGPGLAGREALHVAPCLFSPLPLPSLLSSLPGREAKPCQVGRGLAIPRCRRAGIVLTWLPADTPCWPWPQARAPHRVMALAL